MAAGLASAMVLTVTAELFEQHSVSHPAESCARDVIIDFVRPPEHAEPPATEGSHFWHEWQRIQRAPCI
jgi:hypothetical protein